MPLQKNPEIQLPTEPPHTYEKSKRTTGRPGQRFSRRNSNPRTYSTQKTGEEIMTDEEKDDNTIRITEENLEIPLVDVLTGRGFITGKSGSGKSNTAGKLAEEILDSGYPLMVIDTEGEYYGLKEKYELLHVGADEECDLQVGPEHAEKIAELALEENVPIILDVSGYIETEEVNQLVHDTCKAMFDKEKKLKKPFPIFVEEAHEWIPQQGRRGEDGKVTEMLIRIAKRGRKRGLGVCALSQRPASLDKDFITQANYKIWHQLDYSSDLKVVREVLGKEYVDTVSELDTGSAILQADFLEDTKQQVKILKKKTFDAGATPDLEEFERPELKSVSGDLVEELQEISEQKQKEQDRIEQLEEKLKKKEEEIEELEEDLDRAQDMSKMAEQFTQAMASGGSEEVQQKVDEIREEKNSRIRELESSNEELEGKVEELEAERQDLKQRVEELEQYEAAQQKMEELREAYKRMGEALDLEPQGNVDEKLKKRLKKKENKINNLQEKLEEAREYKSSEFIGSSRYDNLAKNIANQNRNLTKSRIDDIMKELDRGSRTLTQLSNSVGIAKATVDNYLTPLKSQGWVKKSGDKYQLTDEVSS